MSKKVKLVQIPCPPEIFDVEGATISRRKRVPVWMVDAMRQSANSDEVYEWLAKMVPEWSGVIDVETGEELGFPGDDPGVFSRIDSLEQLPWISAQLRAKPAPNSQRGRRGRN